MDMVGEPHVWLAPSKGGNVEQLVRRQCVSKTPEQKLEKIVFACHKAKKLFHHSDFEI